MQSVIFITIGLITLIIKHGIFEKVVFINFKIKKSLIHINFMLLYLLKHTIWTVTKCIIIIGNLPILHINNVNR